MVWPGLHPAHVIQFSHRHGNPWELSQGQIPVTLSTWALPAGPGLQNPLSTALLDTVNPVHQVQVGAGNSPGAGDPETQGLWISPCTSHVPMRSTL